MSESTYCIEIHHKTNWVDSRSCSHYYKLDNYKSLDESQSHIEWALLSPIELCSAPYQALMDR